MIVRRIRTNTPGLFRLQRGGEPLHHTDGAYVYVSPGHLTMRWILLGGEVVWSNMPEVL